MQRAIEHLTTPAQQFRLSWAIGAARLRRGRYVVSDWFMTAEGPAMVAAIRQSGDLEATTFVLYMLGWVTLLYGDLDEAEQDLQEALALAERTRHLVNRTWILTWLSVLHRKRGEAEATREYALRGLPVAMAAGLLENAALVRGNLIATQFHPEKSGANGLKMYHNFLNLTATAGKHRSGEISNEEVCAP